MPKLVQPIQYKTDRAGYPITGPYTAEKYQHKPRGHWLIYGRRAGVSATVLCQACNIDFPTRRDARAFIASHLA
jgi:hypothetical protein